MKVKFAKAVLLFFLAISGSLYAQEYIRLVEHRGSSSLETPVIHFTRETDNVQVDLIGAVHIGDKKYYQVLNLLFKTYETVAYEMIGQLASQGEQASPSMVSSFQIMMTEVLHLKFQLDEIDYVAENLVHGDLDREAFEHLIDEEGGLINFLWKSVEANYNYSLETGADDLGFLNIMMAALNDSTEELKYIFARQLVKSIGFVKLMEKDKPGALIGKRNEKCLQVVDKKIKSGLKHIAIFYGAAHLYDFESRLIKKGFKRQGMSWLKAWHIQYSIEEDDVSK